MFKAVIFPKCKHTVGSKTFRMYYIKQSVLLDLPVTFACINYCDMEHFLTNLNVHRHCIHIVQLSYQLENSVTLGERRQILKLFLFCTNYPI